MVKEAKNIDFYTTGKEPSPQEFERISEWIREKKSNKRQSKIAGKKNEPGTKNKLVKQAKDKPISVRQRTHA